MGPSILITQPISIIGVDDWLVYARVKESNKLIYTHIETHPVWLRAPYSASAFGSDYMASSRANWRFVIHAIELSPENYAWYEVTDPDTRQVINTLERDDGAGVTDYWLFRRTVDRFGVWWK